MIRRFRIILLAAVATGIWARLDAQTKKISNRTPNIILILADDMGKECLGTYGGTYPTPNLDKLANEGLKFNYGFSQPLCTPTRVQIMTGKYNYKNYVEFGYLDPYQKTFAHLAKEAGYNTAIAGKWQLGANNKLPGLFGFDQYCLWQLTYGKNKGERYAKPLIERDANIVKTTDEDFGPDIFVNYILDFITRNKDKKFLAYYPMALVHAPFLPTPDSKRWKESVELRHKNDTLNFRDMVTYSDKNVGKIVAKLKELGIYENTIIIFTGDNGTGRPVVTPMKDGSKVPGGKGLTVDRGHHVPLIVNWGTGRYKDHVTDDLVDFTDILPTIADAIQKKVPADWNTDGHSILPQIRGEKGTPRQWVFSHYNPLQNNQPSKNAARFFRDHRYKLYHDGRFFDLVNDYEEQNPIPEGRGTPEAEAIRKTFAAEFAKLPAWKPSDPGQPKRVRPGYESQRGADDGGE
ncbi:sulfatase-like hydrolase/transferase [Desertivirga arenae]|uniref:sulfatase-like hydrolase/transferase n=1 Tax=Desertivirga arenae TaxID=2810309 RepID=UPI001A969806|nr:sulfatase-like hydrolase/transferase [Pedobacter sp. SYSU D00823]